MNSSSIPQYECVDQLVFDKYFGELDPSGKCIRLAIDLDQTFESRLDEVWERRDQLLKRVDTGVFDDLMIKEPTDSWKPKNYSKNVGLYQQTVLEMTGNALNRMGINAFNYVNRMNDQIDASAPKIAWMCCGEDANGAQWESVCENVRHLRDLVAGEASIEAKGKVYELESKKIPPFSYRPRGFHCIEANVQRVNVQSNQMEPISGSMMDIALWASFVLPLIEKNENQGPLLYIPKMQVVEEAQLWHSILTYVEKRRGLDEGTIKIVFLAETFPAVFNVARFIEAFEGRCIGVNCGRWDYLFSYASLLAEHKRVELDEENIKVSLAPKHVVTTSVDLLKKYQIQVAKMCHHYGIQFIGGMNALLPSSHPDQKIREEQNKKILRETIDNKSQERSFYGASRTWVAHIGLLEVARALTNVPHANPKDKNLRRIDVSRKDLFRAPDDAYTIQDFKNDLSVVILYMTQYLLTRSGAVAVNGLMEDLATAEISCTLNWYFLKHKTLDKQIDQEGGLNKLILQASESVLNTYANQSKSAAAIVSTVANIIAELYIDVSQRPNLEKTLYALTVVDNPRAFNSIHSGNRFKSNSRVADIVLKHNKTSLP